MKTKLFCILLMLSWVGMAWGQRNNYEKGLNDLHAKDHYTQKNTFVSGTNMRSDFSVDVTKDFAASAKLNMTTKNENLNLLLQNDIGSTNSYSPLFNKGKWAMDNSLGATAKWHFKTSRWVFKDDFEKKKDELKYANAPDDTIYAHLDSENKLSQFRTQWLSADLKWDYKEYLLLADNLTPTMEAPFDSYKKNSYVLGTAYNLLWVTSYHHGIYITGSIGYSFQNKGTNYEKLTQVTVSKQSIITDADGNSLIVSEGDEKGRKGALVIGNAHSIKGDLHLTISPPKFGVGFDIFVAPSLKFIGGDEILNLRSGVNVAITKEDKSKVNIGLVVDFKNLTEPFKDAVDRRSRIVPGLLLGIPIPSGKL